MTKTRREGGDRGRDKLKQWKEARSRTGQEEKKRRKKRERASELETREEKERTKIRDTRKFEGEETSAGDMKWQRSKREETSS